MTVTLRTKATYIVRKSNGTFVRKDVRNATGIFTRGTKFGDLQYLSDNISSVNVSVGWSGKELHSSKLSYAYLASILEKGTLDGRIPPRPYLKLSGRLVAESLNRKIKKSLRLMMSNGIPLTTAGMIRRLDTDVSPYAESRTKTIIRERGASVLDNSLSTLSQKRGSRPWINSGELVSALKAKAQVDKSI